MLAAKEKLPGTHTVYNLEVRELHNFLVGTEGVVVHNSYFPDAKQLAKTLGVSEDFFYKKLKKDMINDWKNDFPPGFGHHPDIGISNTGNLLFKSRLSGEVFDTNFEIINYVD